MNELKGGAWGAVVSAASAAAFFRCAETKPGHLTPTCAFVRSAVVARVQCQDTVVSLIAVMRPSRTHNAIGYTTTRETTIRDCNELLFFTFHFAL
uniref:Secreted protein n=1 Tax=Plectus sambesii TaxID=2011161 RepID=A0A914W566_9BILA